MLAFTLYLPIKAPKGVKLLIHENSSVDGIDERGDCAKSFILDSAADVHPEKYLIFK